MMNLIPEPMNMQQYSPLGTPASVNCTPPSQPGPLVASHLASHLAAPPGPAAMYGFHAPSMLPGGFPSVAHHNPLLTAAAVGALPGGVFPPNAAFNPGVQALTLAERLAGELLILIGSDLDILIIMSHNL